MEKIGDGAAVFLGAPTPSSDYDFRQGHDFFYLTGVEIPDAFLVVDGMRKESVLFFTMSETTADGEAIPLDLIRTPADYTGIERVLPAEQFSAQLAGLANRGRPLYTMFKPEELGRENSNEKFNALQKSMTLSPWDGRLTRELQFVRQLRERFPQADVRDSSPIVWNLRKYQVAGGAGHHAAGGAPRRPGPQRAHRVDAAGRRGAGAGRRVRVRLQEGRARRTSPTTRSSCPARTTRTGTTTSTTGC